MSIKNNTASLQNLLNAINALPEAGSGELPVLTNPANASELLNGKELIDGKGKIITGSMPNNGSIALTMDGIDTKTVSIPEGYTSGGTVSLDGTIGEEVEEQADLIEQIKNVANNLPEAGSGELVLQDKTVTPTKDTQTIIADNGYDGLNEVTVNAIPSTYVQPSSTRAATTYTPTTTNQTIAAGTYLTGVQTIKGDANLISSNIVSGKTIFGVAGSAEVGGGGGSSSIETCTVQVEFTAPPMEGITFFYITPNFVLETLLVSRGGSSFTVPKNTIVAIKNWGAMDAPTGAVQLFYNMGYAAYQVTDNAIFTYSG